MDANINLVDGSGKRIGSIDKLEAHAGGILHEAFSIFVFNENNELLIQKRSLQKYHSGGLWTNTCCSHPLVGEDIRFAIHRRLMEEMGFDCELESVYSFVYKTGLLENNLIENEFDTIFVGHIKKETKVIPNKDEVCDYRWISMEDLIKEIKTNPELFTVWFKIIIDSPDFLKVM